MEQIPVEEIRALVVRADGLRLIEVDKQNLGDLPDIIEVVRHWVPRLGCVPEDWEELERAALQWALRRGSRSGRTAWQFARDWAGRRG
jgi:predicted AAA+ superfamily ATPase